MLQGVEMFGHQDDTKTSAQPAPAATDWMSPPVAESALPVEPTSAPIVPAATAPVTITDRSAPLSGSDDLIELKKQALQHLSPLIGQLDQSPEEKFRTTMMMIQASDDQALLKDAFTAAQAIGDDKQRAQALLDVINEINYFTQQQAAN